MKVWSGRFSKKTDKQVEEFTSSLAEDMCLYEQDIKGSVAHAKMLAKQKIIKSKEAKAIVDGLRKIGQKIKEGKFKFLLIDEDIHMAIERGLISLIGEIGGKLHTARSRNDQVATDMRVYIKEQTRELQALIRQLQRTIIKVAKGNQDVIMPGYTHLQKAQPVLFAHYLMAYFWMLERDFKRLNCCYNHADVLPLGSGALVGTTFNIDRSYLAQELGFSKISDNSMDSVSDRDYLLVFLSAANLIMLHLSRLAEEIIIFSTEEFGYFELDEAFATGSSIMPQKKNPDVAELVRGKSAKVAASYQALSGLIKGLPLTYNRDLQEDKNIVFDALNSVKSCLSIMQKMLVTTKINSKKMLESVQNSFANATDLADYLVGKGLPFREAHLLVGQLIKKCLNKGIYLNELSLEECHSIDKIFDQDLFDTISLKTSIAKHNSFGGTSHQQVKRQIAKAEKLLKL